MLSDDSQMVCPLAAAFLARDYAADSGHTDKTDTQERVMLLFCAATLSVTLNSTNSVSVWSRLTLNIRVGVLALGIMQRILN